MTTIRDNILFTCISCHTDDEFHLIIVDLRTPGYVQMIYEIYDGAAVNEVKPHMKLIDECRVNNKYETMHFKEQTGRLDWM